MKTKPTSHDDVLKKQRRRVYLFLLGAVLLFLLFAVTYQGIVALERLDAVEVERDQWQRPDDVMQALGVREGSVVVDLGSGAGYFTLKLSRAVGANGQVIAVDLRSMSLTFLRIRALRQRRWNIGIRHANFMDVALPPGTVDAVLIANTYHELTDRGVILNRAFQALRPGGRLVIADRGVEGGAGDSVHHEMFLSVAEAEIRKLGFEALSRNARFIDRPPDRPWWLLVARKP